MAQSVAPSWQRAQVAVAVTLIAAVIVLVLYLAASIFVPFALAIFFSFLLNPLVSILQRNGLGRVPSVILVTGLTAVLVVALTWLAARQISGLIGELPDYTPNIKAKARALRDAGLGSGAGRFERMYEEIVNELAARPVEPTAGDIVAKPANDAQVAVVMHSTLPPWVSYLVSLVPPLLAVIAQSGLTFVLVVFMLLKREDMRNRFIRLVGRGRLTVTTRAVDEAASRISRFLLVQFTINAAFGLMLAMGLWLIGVRYAALWGVLGFLMRYIPYLGTWLGLIVPLALSLFTAPDFVQPALVLCLYMTLELGCNNFVEPYLYGSTVGVSEVAMLVMAAVWTFVWGPIGLVLTTPLTVCLVVLGKNVPQLEALDVLLGDSPPLEPDVTYYQRLLAHDQDEAIEIVQSFIAANPRDLAYDGLLVPSLCYARRDRERDELSDDDEVFVLQTTREVMAEVGPIEDRVASTPDGEVRVLGLATRDEFDEAALELFRQLLEFAPGEMEIAPADMLAGEQVNLVEKKQPAIICVASLPPGGLSNGRYLCKRLRARYPGAKILVGRWGLRGNRETNEAQLREAGADQVGFTMLESRTQVRAWLPVAESEGQNGNGAPKPRRKHRQTG